MPVDRSHLVQRPNIGTESTVDAEYLSVDQCGQSEGVEARYAVLPRAGVAVFSQALVVEAVHLSDLSTFVIASQQRDVSGVLQFEAQ